MKDNPGFKKLIDHFDKLKKLNLRSLFKNDPQRGEKFRIVEDGLYFDFSKNLITDQTLDYLLDFAKNRELKGEMERMFRGERINKTENRAVMHTAIRDFGEDPIMLDKKNIKPEILKVREKMEKLAGKIRKGEFLGYTKKPINNIVNIGIGGSDLGPRMVVRALSDFSIKDLRYLFVSNVDFADLSDNLKGLNPEETLFIIASKTFNTLETRTNAESARAWIINHYKTPRSIPHHFIGITTNITGALDFGVDPENILEFWDWVGGRYSLTCAIGLSIMIAIGSEKYREFLKGFFSMDQHFRYKKLEENIPVLLALLGFLYNNLFKWETQAVFPYSYNLNLFPSYLQQLEMESNGKSVTRQGKDIDYQTSQIIWGATGTNSQHAFFQLIHQGTKKMPCDFIGFASTPVDLNFHHEKLISNMLGQAEALAFGKQQRDLDTNEIPDKFGLFKIVKGNIPSNVLLLKQLNPYYLGKLIALYEHKVFVLGILWDIYSFDQWGVELGKTLADNIFIEFKENREIFLHDSSTRCLMNYYKKQHSK